MNVRRLAACALLAFIVMASLTACANSRADDDSSEIDRDDRPMAASADDTANEDGDTDEDASEAPDADSPIGIGVVLSLSGPVAVYGESSRRGIELAIEDLRAGNGKEFAAAFLDDAGDAETGAEQFQQHIDNGVLAILGPTLSNTAFEAHPVAQENGVPVLAISNTAAGITDIGDSIFRVSLSEAAVVPQTVELIADAWQPRTAALVFSEDDAWSRSSADAFRSAAESHGIEIVTEQDIPSDGDDFSEQITAVAESEADVIFLSALEAASIGFVTQARDSELEQNIACGNGCNSGEFIRGAGEAAEGLIVGSAWHIEIDNERSKAFVERFQDLHGVDPDQFAAQSYAGMQILAEALQTAETMDREALRDALAGLGTVDTVLGTFTFDESRDGSHPAVVSVVQSGEFVIYGK